MDKDWVALKRAVYNNKFRNTVIQKVFITFSRRTYFLAAVFLAAGFLALAAGFLAAGFLALVAGFLAAGFLAAGFLALVAASRSASIFL